MSLHSRQHGPSVLSYSTQTNLRKCCRSTRRNCRCMASGTCRISQGSWAASPKERTAFAAVCLFWRMAYPGIFGFIVVVDLRPYLFGEQVDCLLLDKSGGD